MGSLAKCTPLPGGSLVKDTPLPGGLPSQMRPSARWTPLPTLMFSQRFPCLCALLSQLGSLCLSQGLSCQLSSVKQDHIWIALLCHVGLLARCSSARPSHKSLCMHVCMYVNPQREGVSAVAQVCAGCTAVCTADCQHHFAKRATLPKGRWIALLCFLYARRALAFP